MIQYIPIFEDGEYVVIERVNNISKINKGNIIIANIDGELYIKKESLSQSIYLISENNFYRLIGLKKDESLKRFNLIGIGREKYRVI